MNPRFGLSRRDLRIERLRFGPGDVVQNILTRRGGFAKITTVRARRAARMENGGQQDKSGEKIERKQFHKFEKPSKFGYGKVKLTLFRAAINRLQRGRECSRLGELLRELRRLPVGFDFDVFERGRVEQIVVEIFDVRFDQAIRQRKIKRNRRKFVNGWGGGRDLRVRLDWFERRFGGGFFGLRQTRRRRGRRDFGERIVRRRRGGRRGG